MKLFWLCQSDMVMINDNDKTLYIVLPSVPQDHSCPDHPLIYSRENDSTNPAVSVMLGSKGCLLVSSDMMDFN